MVETGALTTVAPVFLCGDGFQIAGHLAAVAAFDQLELDLLVVGQASQT